MPSSTINRVAVRGIAAAVPDASYDAARFAGPFGAAEMEKLTASTGVLHTRIARGTMCTSDLCLAAARRLIADLGWEPHTIQALLFVSQTPDYLLPATSCVLHDRLGLSPDCAALDLNLGCSGYVYGLWAAGQLMQSSGVGRALLLAGDTISRICSPLDRSVVTLFGDAGSATALETDGDAPPIHFRLGTDGSGWKHLLVPAGGFRNPRSPDTAVRTGRDDGNVRSEEDLFMDGAEVFAFALKVVPRLFASIVSDAGWTRETVDAAVLHQANRFMLHHLGKRMGVPAEKLPLTLEEFGNTSSASIPLTVVSRLQTRLSSSALNLVLAGFGVGFSWAAAALRCGPAVVPPIVELPAAECT